MLNKSPVSASFAMFFASCSGQTFGNAYFRCDMGWSQDARVIVVVRDGSHIVHDGAFDNGSVWRMAVYQSRVVREKVYLSCVPHMV